MSSTPGSPGLPRDPLGEGTQSGTPSAPDEGAVARGAQNDAWAAFGLITSGVVVWGGIGYALSRWLHNSLFTMVGLLVGTGTALYAVWVRYGKAPS